MAGRRVGERFLVDGMTCSHCEQRIEKAVRGVDGVHMVSASASLGEVMVYYDPEQADRHAIVDAISGAGYVVRGEPAAGQGEPAAGPGGVPPRGRGSGVYRLLGLIAVVVAVYLIIRHTVGFTFLPAVSQSMGYGLIFVVGLLTSLHCIAMCGGIVLSQGISKRGKDGDGGAPPSLGARLLPNLLYNGGRVVSYTVIGGVVGAIGSLFSLSAALKGAMPVVAGVFMLFLGVRMLGIFPWLSRLKVRLPSIGGTRMAAALEKRGSRSPLIVGLLNGLMPCGPLQTLQVYALGTGSFLAGALSMFLFSLGTVPLLLGFGVASSLLSAKFSRTMLKASGALVMALGLVMFSRGLSLFGLSLPSAASLVSPVGAAVAPGVAVATISGGYQKVRTTVESGQYHPLVVQAGIPVRWTISARADDLNGCNNPVTVPRYGIRKQLVPGDNLIEFTPTQPGTITYTCWMGMVSSTIRVVPDLATVAASSLAAAPDSPAAPAATAATGAPPDLTGAGGCCSAPPPGFAGGAIPTEVIQTAAMTEAGQVADVAVNAQGYTPAVIVMKRGVKGKVRFKAESLSVCNYYVSFPDYGGGLDLSKGQLETPFLDVSQDFTFECGMGMLHGYVKVVDDPSKIDVAALRREISTLRPGVGQ